MIWSSHSTLPADGLLIACASEGEGITKAANFKFDLNSGQINQDQWEGRQEKKIYSADTKQLDMTSVGGASVETISCAVRGMMREAVILPGQEKVMQSGLLMCE